MLYKFLIIAFMAIGFGVLSYRRGEEQKRIIINIILGLFIGLMITYGYKFLQ